MEYDIPAREPRYYCVRSEDISGWNQWQIVAYCAMQITKLIMQYVQHRNTVWGVLGKIRHQWLANHHLRRNADH